MSPVRPSREPTADPTPRAAVVHALPLRADDAALVARLLQGDRWAADGLYRRHAPAVIRVATLLLGRGADVDDVLQDAFVKALRQVATLRDPAMFGAWVSRIAVNLARSRLRRRRLLQRLGLDRAVDDVDLAQFPAPSLGPEDRAELSRISARLRALPADAQVAWTLRRVEAWPLADIAEALGLSLATTKRRIAVADAAMPTRTDDGGEG